MKGALRGIWGEHGAWAIGLSCYGAGLIAGWPPRWPAVALLPATVFFIGGKGLAQRARRTGREWVLLGLFGVAGALAALPTAVAAPVPFAGLAIFALLFLVLYFRFADKPSWTRSLGIELTGTLLLGSVSGLVVLASHPGETARAILAWPLFIAFFLPGVVRAKMMKHPTPALRTACSLFALAGTGLAAWSAWSGTTAWWGALAALAFGEDMWAVFFLPRWPTKTLGVVLTAKNAAACILLAAAWLAAS